MRSTARLPPGGPERGRAVVRAIALAAIAEGATVLLGWALDRPELTMLRSRITMKPNAAVCVLLLGAALWRTASRRESGRDAVAWPLSVAAALLGGATLFEHVSGLDLGIDRLLSSEPPGMPATASPGRMGPPASMSFLLLGAALASIGSRRAAAQTAVHVLAIAAAFLALLSLVGYAYGSAQLYGVAGYTGIALPTALVLEALAVGVLLVVPDGGLVAALRGDGAAGRLARRALVYATLVPLGVGWAVAQGLRARLYDGVLAVSFLALLPVIAVTLLIWRDAFHVARMERQREAALRERERSAEALREREEEAREANRRKDEFLAVLSHELRNPLAPIRNGLYLLARADAGSDEARRALAVIDRQAAHLARLVDDLLDVSRISRGRVALRRASLDLGELVRRTAEDHRSAASAAGLGLAVEVPDDPLWIDGDATRLAQSIGNLLGNAVKYTPRGGRVTVSVARGGELAATLRVRDTGVGIEGPLLARLFEPFAQADATLDRTGGGLGLGLALVKGFVELHGGTVAARSDGAGRGTELVVTLPLRDAPDAATPAAARRSPGRPLRILVVEDNADAAETLREVLEFSGHSVQVACDGEEGLAAARRAPPDVVLCDVGLPGLDGYGVARALRAEAGLRETVLIAVTGYASPEDRRRAFAAGFDHLFAKPADLADLLELLASPSPRRDAVSPPAQSA